MRETAPNASTTTAHERGGIVVGAIVMCVVGYVLAGGEL